jgi:hypothetical protein
MARALVPGIPSIHVIPGRDGRGARAHMTATTYRAITDLTARLLIGALLLGAMIAIGIGVTRAHRPAAVSVDSLL